MSSTMDKVVTVSVDFGTTFSGCAFTNGPKSEDISLIDQWPDADGHYPKTKTELYYSKDDKGHLKLQSWGATALHDFTQALPSTRGEYIREVKLHLAGPEYGEPPKRLPGNLTPKIVITDYLREISKYSMDHLRDVYGPELSMQDVQWFLTVPAIWDDSAKQLMKSYAEAAGLVRTRNPNGSSTEGSPHQLRIVLEPEAAAVYCITNSNKLQQGPGKLAPLNKGDKFMTADLGGGTVDLVVHEKVCQDSHDVRANLKMKEIAKSSGGLCGSTFVDKRFIVHLSERIPCFKLFMEENPSSLIDIMTWWDGIKRTFNATTTQRWSVPSDLAEAWKHHNEAKGCPPPEHGYGVLVFTKEDLINLFMPVVKDVIAIIEKALQPFADKEVKTIMAVGGFSANPYLKKRLKETFETSGRVGRIQFPINPGSAICVGAAMIGMAPDDPIISRVSRKTYGQEIVRRPWRAGDPEEFKKTAGDGEICCEKVFLTFVRKGDEVQSDTSITKELIPLFHDAETMTIGIYSSAENADPKYITDLGVVLESEFRIDISSGMRLGTERRIAVTMSFGRSVIEVTAEGVNFEASGKADRVIPVAFIGGSSIPSAAMQNVEDDKKEKVEKLRALSIFHARS